MLDAHSVFERTLNVLPLEKAKMVWNKFIDYENQFGDLQTLMDVEKRKKEVYQQGFIRLPTLTRWFYGGRTSGFMGCGQALHLR